MNAETSDRTCRAAEASATAAHARQAYAQQSRQQLEEHWIVQHLPLVRHIVHKIASPMASRDDIDDLISAGTLGLVRAAKAYDPSREADFKTYAYIRVRGAVIDELRSRSFVPASVHKQIRRIREAFQVLQARTGHAPTDEELAAEVGLPPADMYKALEEARKQDMLSLHAPGEGEGICESFHPRSAEPSPDQQAERREMLDVMTEAIQSLPERDRLVVLLYYDRDLTMKEGAAVLGVTESRFSQLHSSAVFKLSMKMGVRR